MEDGIRAVAVRGELDMSAAPQLESRLEEALSGPGTSLVLDLTGCEFIDSTGIALIVRTWQRLQESGEGGRLVLCCVDDQVRRMLRLTGVESSIPLHEDRDAAIAALRE